MFNLDAKLYRKDVEHLLSTKCGLSINDVSVDYIDQCNKCGQPPKECFDELVEKYDLDTF